MKGRLTFGRAQNGGWMTDPGLCGSCRHSRQVRGANSRFWLCERSRTDPRFPRYPRLPVLRCAGHESRGGEALPAQDAGGSDAGR
jgi:hypothetical protein